MSSQTPALLQGAFLPLGFNGLAPIIVDTNVGTTAALLTADLPGNEITKMRRVRLLNTSTTGTISLIIVPRGQAAGAQTVASGTRISPGSELSVLVSARVRMLVVADEAATTFNATISDA